MWHVIQTAPRAEVHVCRYLALQGVEPYAPQFAPPPRTRPGSVRDRQPRWVFPGYVFLRPPQGFDAWDRLRWAPGVHRLLQEGGVPGFIPDAVVAHLRQRLARRTVGARRSWQPGERVLVMRGPLREVDAIFDRDLDGPARVRILVNLLGRQLPVEVDPATLVPAG